MSTIYGLGTKILEELSKNHSDNELLKKCYASGEILVEEGALVNKLNEDYSYSAVPLGIIQEGTVEVYEYGIAVRTLRKGDCIGVFETCHAINSTRYRKRTIGSWTLKASDRALISYLNLNTVKLRNISQKLYAATRDDNVPTSISTMPQLDKFAGMITERTLDSTIIIAHTHILPSMVPLFKHLAQLVGRNNMYVVEKPYSTVESTLSDLQKYCIHIEPVSLILPEGQALSLALENVINEITLRKFKSKPTLLLLDDGGEITARLSKVVYKKFKVKGVEQTSRGINRYKDNGNMLSGIVNVARSQSKLMNESPIIAKSILKAIDQNINIDNQTIGIIGNGLIGMNIHKELSLRKIQGIYLYDPDKISSSNCSLRDLVVNSDIIIGATGVDALRGIDFSSIEGVKHLFSASSRNNEFLCILGPHRSVSFSTLPVKPHSKLTLNVYNGGYPINFNRLYEIESPQEMALTRMLLYAGIIQSANEESALCPTPLKSRFQSLALKIWRESSQNSLESF
jgi:hypothetical protein